MAKAKKPEVEKTESECKSSPEFLAFLKQQKAIAAFNKLSKPKQRIAVAKDVLVLLRKYKVKLGSASVLRLKLDKEMAREGFGLNFGLNVGDELIKFLPALLAKKHCEVCGIGACLLSVVRLANDYKVSVRLGKGSEDAPGEAYARVVKVFGIKNAYLIEKAFERGGGAMEYYFAYAYDDTSMWVRRAAIFGGQYKDDRKRMIAIMKNIIANNGDFIPPKLKKAKK